MIVHIVLFKLKDFAEGKTRDDNIKIILDMLSGLPSKIPQIKKYEFGCNISKSENSSDIALVSEFNTLEDLEIYRNHPEHKIVIDFIRKVITEARVVDFERK